MKKLTGKKKWIVIIAIAVAVILCVGVALLLIFQDQIWGNDETTAQTTTQTTTVETTTEATTIQTEPPVRFRHPLTGEPVDELYTTRPVAVSVNNIQAALPQYGVSKADILYEFETEGGITRFCALFTDLENIKQIGPIRSARSYFNNISAAYNAPLIHCGGSETGKAGYYDFNNKLTNWEHIDQVYNGAYFFRDEDRYYNQGYNWEHTLFTTGEKLLTAFDKKEMDMVNEDGTDYGLVFDDDVVVQGDVAKEITVKFLGTKTTTMTYNEASGKYQMSEYGDKLIDALTNEQVEFSNVLVIFADQTKQRPRKTLLSYYDMIGTGEGYFAHGGNITKIKWSRKKVTEPFSYTYTDGTPVTLGVGNSYAAVVDFDGSVKYE